MDRPSEHQLGSEEGQGGQQESDDKPLEPPLPTDNMNLPSNAALILTGGEQPAGASNGNASHKQESAMKPSNRTPEDLAIALDTALEVNRHLNREVENLMKELDALRKAKEAAEEHGQQLSKKLSAVRREGNDTAGIPDLKAMRPPSPQHEADAEAAPQNNQEWELLRERAASNGWLVDPSAVEMGAECGRGAFGVTHRAVWRGADIALKRVRVGSREDAASFLREVEAMSSVRHSCVLPFIGAVLHPPDRCWILMEWMPGGTLKTWIHGDRKAGVPPKKAPLSVRLQKSLEVACGMQALQETDPQIMHRDLKPSNILLDSSGVARVADMGLARRYLIETASVQTGETGTYLYMAPEVMQHNDYDTKADVFSWAIMTAELITERLPYEELYMTPLQVAMAVCSNNLRPTLPPTVHPGVTKLLEAAWARDASKRPFFREIARKMRKFIQHVKRDELDRQQAPNPVGNFIRGFAGWGGRPKSALP
eukprot:CAMPEP_0117663918 /NCGR_PEP_ID=MMETSP0804-20121206/8891_1 /TAXON_ID=1074897 /ORGANISM="Tetraselmis astigmatica, Strain CCMP880" /LENGTH=482 /DNA_ID=CAMNT_0005471013 /DNA_START=333 /DNA_END=1781 /DNA_ORIENTATION=-